MAEYGMDDEDHDFFDEHEDDECHIPFDEILDPDGENEPDDSSSEEKRFNSKRGVFVFPPSMEEAELAFKDLTNILKPPRVKGRGFKDPKLDKVTIRRLEGVRLFLGAYVRMEKKHPKQHGNWMEASNQTAEFSCKKSRYARSLRNWSRAFINDQREIPGNNHGKASKSAIDDEDFAQEIHLYLQSIGKYVKAEDIIKYCQQPDVLAQLKRTKTISLATGRRWMEKMGYRWRKNF
ncbi:hypothetical protein C0992_007456 [Termitomyces sp. T32_za158]|nr:hypothetical protein C0992_007456 [Termitomyces sp. T32_za158]